MFQLDAIRWKCFAPHPFWEGSRAYALRYKGEIAAFGCVVPSRFLTPDGAVPVSNVIDWSASKAVPGAGIMLYRHIQSLAPVMINIGGTEDARSVLPKIGFQARLERHGYTRVLRPWRYFLESREKNWKSLLRLARDYRELARSISNRGIRAAALNQLPREAFPAPAAAGPISCLRSQELIDYFRACPLARFQPYLLECSGEGIGYFLLSTHGAHSRIADLWVRSAEIQDWSEAYAAAVQVAADMGSNQVTAGASAPLQMQALRSAGFRRTLIEPVFVRDPETRLASGAEIALNLLENDAAYWRAR